MKIVMLGLVLLAASLGCIHAQSPTSTPPPAASAAAPPPLGKLPMSPELKSLLAQRELFKSYLEHITEFNRYEELNGQIDQEIDRIRAEAKATPVTAPTQTPTPAKAPPPIPK